MMTAKHIERVTWFRQCLKEFHRSRGEEIANFITHLVGVVFGIVALTMMCVFSAQNRTALYTTSCAVFGATLIILYTASMLYHLVSDIRLKSRLQLFDHSSIYLLIAGSYMPFVLLTISSTKAWTVFGVEWLLAIAGITMEMLCPRRLANIISLPIFIAMGWLVVFVFRDICASLSTPALWLLISGGLSYTVGIIFFLMDHVPYMHTVWHVFVLGGSICHWVAITFFLLFD